MTIHNATSDENFGAMTTLIFSVEESSTYHSCRLILIFGFIIDLLSLLLLQHLPDVHHVIDRHGEVRDEGLDGKLHLEIKTWISNYFNIQLWFPIIYPCQEWRHRWKVVPGTIRISRARSTKKDWDFSLIPNHIHAQLWDVNFLCIYVLDGDLYIWN